MIKFIVGYLLMGVIVELWEEAFIARNADKIFGIEPEKNLIKVIISRWDKHYNWKLFLIYIRDIMIWPIGIIFWYLGIKRIIEEGIDIEECMNNFYDKYDIK